MGDQRRTAAGGSGRQSQWLLLALGVGATGTASVLLYQWWHRHSRQAPDVSGEAAQGLRGEEEEEEEEEEDRHSVVSGGGDVWDGPNLSKELLERAPFLLKRVELSRQLKQHYQAHAAGLPKEVRNNIMIEFKMNTVAERWNPMDNKCEKCWLVKTVCLCGKLEALDLPIDFIIYMHTKEYHRASNTGRLIAMSHPTSIMLVSGLKEHEDQLREMYDAEPDNMVMLFPSSDSVTLTKLMQEREAKGIKGRLRVVLPDGTWRQARRCVRKLPDAMRKVRIVAAAQTRFMLRTRTREDGICSIEAAATLIENLGRPDQAEIMLRHLDKLNEAVIDQTGGFKGFKAEALRVDPSLALRGDRRSLRVVDPTSEAEARDKEAKEGI